MPPSRGDDEARLVAEARRGDGAAFDALVGGARDHLYRAALRIFSDAETALDCVQETLLRAWESLPRFREQCSFATWLDRIFRHVCSEEQRRQLRWVRDAHTADLAHDLGLDDAIARREEVRVALQALAELPLGLRTASLLNLVEGCSHAETGAILGLSAQAVKMRVSRARRLLRLPVSAPAAQESVRFALAASYRLIGTLLLQQGQEEESDQAVLRAIKYAPNSAYSAWTQYDRARGTPLYAPAEKQAERVLGEAARWPEGAVARVAQANFYNYERHDWLEAERRYVPIAAEPTEAGALARIGLGSLYLNTDRPHLAVPVLLRNVADFPNDPFSLVLAARSLAMLRDPGASFWAQRARAAALRGWLRDPAGEPACAWGMQTARIRIVAAEIFLLLGDARAAKRLALAALKVIPETYVDDRPQRMLAQLSGAA